MTLDDLAGSGTVPDWALAAQCSQTKALQRANKALASGYSKLLTEWASAFRLESTDDTFHVHDFVYHFFVSTRTLVVGKANRTTHVYLAETYIKTKGKVRTIVL